MQLLDDESEAAVGAVHTEEDRGDVLRGAAGALGGAVVRVALVEGQRMVLPAGELLPLENPAVKYLGEEHMQCFRSQRTLQTCSKSFPLYTLGVRIMVIICGFGSVSTHLPNKDL